MTVDRRKWGVLAVLVGLLVGAPGVAQAGADPGDEVVVQTDSGPVRGVNAVGYRLFQGIPYAAAPVGAARWEPPRPPAHWVEPREASTPGDRCPQRAGQITQPSVSEDCLSLNVTAPHDQTPRPVLVWVHGGSFIAGAGADFDARRLSTLADAVVVTFNYRLGVFGFLAHPDLGRSSDIALQDQQAALRWVRRNVAAFGGDPGNVTLFGESAGGRSVCAHVVSPSSAGLFDKVILQSGGCLKDWPKNGIGPGSRAGSSWVSRASAEQVGVGLATELGCTGAEAAACLRGKSVAELLAAGAKLKWSPIYGNSVLPENPVTVLHEHRFNQVPVLSGNTLDEDRLNVSGAYPQGISADRYRELLQDSFGGDADRVADTYPLDAFGTPTLAWATLTTDRVFVCNTLTANRLLADRVPTFAYEFADREAPVVFADPAGIPPGAYHASELAYLFDLAGVSAKLTPDQERLAEAMIRSWGRFAATGDPNGPGLPQWPALRPDAAVPYVQAFAPGDGGIRAVDLSREHHCDLWNSVGS
ncbi:carboxylesterase family protein [Nocardia panacis]|uniref:Carboxylic ester hydrolase n=1 Tax=Nocardia panacis TaxID=2340916 RepID=A0A3A4KB91_9NOCA|nr:carboxylesterase family protein [Nocardia panacis]RJO70710.1 carboxylesterase family protein [Nocardia panacis]